jgi:large subunit ribosomal protein L29
VKTKEIRALEDDKLASQLASSREELMTLRFSHAAGALENPSRLTLLKRQIARMATVQTERKRLAAASAASTKSTTGSKTEKSASEATAAGSTDA